MAASDTQALAPHAADPHGPSGAGKPAARLPAEPDQPRRRWWAIVALACMAFFLFTPKTPSSDCIQIITVFHAVQVPLNCDSRLLAKLYRDAEKYFTEFNNWKGRPIFFLYGVAAAPVLQAVAVPLWAVIGNFAQSDRKLSHYSKYFSLHLAYYLLNIGVVLFSVWLAFNLLGLASATPLAIALSAAIATTDLAAGTVWLAHTNIFNLLAPIACAWFVRLGMQARITSAGALYAWMGGGGLMLLVYPLFVILLPAFIAGLALDGLMHRGQIGALVRKAGHAAAAAILFVLPVILWSVTVRYIFSTPVYMTAQYGQFVWLADAYHNANLWPALSANWSAFIASLYLHFSWFEILLPLAGCAGLLVTGDRSQLRLADPVIPALAIAAIGILGFNFLQGYYAARLQVSVASLLYMLVARLAFCTGRPRIGVGVLAAIALAQFVDASLHYAVTAE